MSPAYSDSEGGGGGGDDDDDDDDDDNDDSSSSSDSDDEYLTSGGDGGEGSREDMIRKKLLESFYGTSAVAAATAAAAAVADSRGGSADSSSSMDRVRSGEVGGSAMAAAAETTTTTTTTTTMTTTRGEGRVGGATGGTPLSSLPDAATSATSATTALPSTCAPPSSHPSTSDLDSPYFSARSFAERHIRSSSVHALLETDESLALDIRSLDSTMQTLVYENYSKFIDATDAVRSIGRSVDSSEAGLARLRLGITRIEEGTRAVDASLRASRDAVAEKIRVQRLLSRLDALLRLPKTLRTLIDAGRYRLAAKSHLSATAILGRHSAGFESLKSIEAECDAILGGMMKELQRKLLYWSGEAQRRSSPLLRRRKHLLTGGGTGGGGGGGGDDDMTDMNATFSSDDDDADADQRRAIPDKTNAAGLTPRTPERSFRRRRGPPLPPKNLAEIFECAGTLLIFSRQSNKGGAQADDDDDDDDGGEKESIPPDNAPRFESGLGAAECKSFALDACGRLLERALDAHNIRLEEEQEEEGKKREKEKESGSTPLTSAVPFGSVAAKAKAIAAAAAGGDGKSADAATKVAAPGARLIPATFLDGVLESATLYGVTLSGTPSPSDLLGGGGVAAEQQLPSLRSAASRMNREDIRLLTEFVSTLFGSFLGHVRMALLERSIEGEERAWRLAAEGEGEGAGGVGGGGGGGSSIARRAAEEADETAFAEITSALSYLLRSVRELASGLALPEVGIDVQVASNLVDQTAEMTESIARRRIRRKFVDLRARVARETLGPFAREAVAEIPAEEGGVGVGINVGVNVGGGAGAAAAEEDGARVVRIVRMASVALSDGMQLADDAVRAMLSRESALGAPGAPVDSSIIRMSVEKNARKFGMWLASALEMLAGLDDPDARVTLDVLPPRGEGDDDDDDDDDDAEDDLIADSARIAAASRGGDFDSVASDTNNFGDLGGDRDDESLDVLGDILSDLEKGSSHEARLNLILAIAEMCRLAERTVPDAMNQSIALSTEEETRAAVKAGGFFESSSSAVAAVMRACKSEVDPEGRLAARFRTAASRSLYLFAVSRGSDAAAFGCADVMEIACFSVDKLPSSLPAAPTEKAWRILEVAKATCIDCAAVLGGDVRSGPVPAFPEDDDVGTLLMSGRAPLGGGGGIKGLQLDVERMFTERVQVYPHPSRAMDFDRIVVVATVLKVAFRAMIETCRVCSFSAFGYRQLQVDCEFLRHLLTHYVRDETMSDGTNPVTGLCNLLNDVMLNAGERCLDKEYVGVSEYYDETGGGIVTPLSIARRFMEEQEEIGEDGIISLFVIPDE